VLMNGRARHTAPTAYAFANREIPENEKAADGDTLRHKRSYL